MSLQIEQSSPQTENYGIIIKGHIPLQIQVVSVY